MNHAPQVHLNDPPPVVERERGDGRERADAGVVADDVDGAEPFERCCGERLHAGRVGDVRVDADGAELRGGCGQRVLLDVRDHHLHAFGEKGARDSLADPRRAARDDGDLPTELREIAHPAGCSGRTLGLRWSVAICPGRPKCASASSR